MASDAESKGSDDRFRWYRHPEKIWALARVVPRKEYGDTPVPPKGSSVLEVEGGLRSVFADADTHIHNLTHTNAELEDIANMDNIHEAPLLWLLSRRYANDNIYTFTSEMVVSINPYKNIEGLYNMSRFLEQSTSDEHLPPPHLFTVAHRASLRLLQGESQSILMSGESGAGKTEASKHVLRFLVNASSAFRSDGGYVGVQVEQCLVGSIPLLETFGNARTVNNDNSSRFGKFMKIHYAAEGSISGAKQETFLLEKTRVVAQDEDEANFHIFYHLLNGASDELRTELKLDQDFDYLCNGLDTAGTGDLQSLDEVKAEMLHMGMDEDAMAQVLRVAAGVLHLGNIMFTGCEDNGDHARVNPTSDASFQAAAELLGLPADLLANALCVRTVTYGSDTTHIPLSVKAATENRNALAKQVYASLFNWLVKQVNVSTSQLTDSAAGAAGAGAGAEAAASSSGGQYIGILDIFGFEVGPENGFSQLCINYANEELQSLYNSHVFVLEQKEYASEGIDWGAMSFQDNKAVLKLLQGKPSGLFTALDEQAMLGDRASDENWLGVVMGAHLGTNPRFSRPKIAPEDKFMVTHYASAVMYRARGFVSRNNDSLQHDLLNVARSSTSSFVSNLFGGSASPSGDGSDAAAMTPSSRRKFAGSVTVSRRFREQMHSLMQQLDKTHPQFIRCVKPNNDKVPDRLDPHLCLHQLKYLGVFETVRIRQSGYPVRRTFRKMAEHCLQLFRGSRAEAMAQLESDPRGLCKTLLTEALGEVTAEQEEGQAPAWQLGTTKAFLRQGKLEEVEAAIAARLRAGAIMLQKIFKGRRARKQYQEKLSQLMLLQVWFAMMRIRRRRRKAAIVVEKNARRFMAKRQFSTSKQACIKIQTSFRSKNARRLYSSQQEAAVKLHAVARGFIQKRRVMGFIGAIIKLQSYVRRRKFRGRHVHVLRSRKKWRDILHSGEAVLLQSLVRKQREKAGLFKVDRQRQLVLTTQPRLIYLDPSVKNVKTAIKGVIPFDKNLKAELSKNNAFILHHSGEDGKVRAMVLTDLIGDAQRWVSAIQKAQTKPTSVKDLYYGNLPEEFQMQGYLFKKKRTKSGWNNKFFVVRHGNISWFSNEHATSAKDSFPLTHATGFQSHGLKPFGFTLVNPSGDQLVLAAPSEDDFEAWNHSIRAVINKLKADAGIGTRNSIVSLARKSTTTPDAGAGAGAGAGASAAAPPPRRRAPPAPPSRKSKVKAKKGETVMANPLVGALKK